MKTKFLTGLVMLFLSLVIIEWVLLVEDRDNGVDDGQEEVKDLEFVMIVRKLVQWWIVHMKCQYPTDVDDNGWSLDNDMGILGSVL